MQASKLISSTIEALNSISQHKTTIDNLDKGVQEIIKRLSFNPGLKIESEDTLYTKPDLVALKKNNDWFISLNDSYMPKTVLENIAFPLQIKGNSKEESIKRGMEMVKLVVLDGR